MHRKVTYRPAADERLVVPDPRGQTGERVWVHELAKYLHHHAGQIRRFAKANGMLRRVKTPARVYWWVTPYSAQRIMAYIRSLQGDAYLKGHRFHEERVKWAAERTRRVARKKMGERA